MKPNDQAPSPTERLIANSEPREFLYGVHSIFATIQGEGIYAGMPAIFVRLAGCNLQCPACDTAYTSSQRLSIPAIIEYIEALKSIAKLIVISGGEPFRQPIGALCHELLQHRYMVQIETNGTLFQPGPWPHVAIICSPKTGKVNHQLQPFINAYKFVAAESDISDDDGLPTIALGHPAAPRLARPHADFKGPVYLQPLDEQDEVKNLRNLDAVVESCLKFGHILCIQIHKIIGVA